MGKINQDQHRLLARQLRKLGLDAQHPPGTAVWSDLLSAINRAYCDADQDRYTLERSLAISSEEMQHLHQRRTSSYEVRLRTLFNTIQDLIWLKSPDGVYMACNQTFERLLGATEAVIVGKTDYDFVDRERADLFREQDRLVLATGGPRVHEEWVTLADGGQRVLVEIIKTPMIDESGELIGVLSVARDITERKRAEAQLQLAAGVFDHAREGITITDVQGTIVDINEAFTRITGYSREDAIGQNPRILSSGRQDKAFYEAMWNALALQGHWSGEIWNRRKNGEVYAELLTISSVRDGQGITQQYVALFSDISAIKEHQSQLERIAHFDALTNLPNRLLLADRLQQAMAQAHRRGQQVAVVYLDLDGFKNVNDHHGHGVGDQLLINLAMAMKKTLREGDTLARLGGDEFVAVLIDLDGVESCVPMLTRLLEAAAAPVPLGEVVLHGSASIGVTFYPQANDMEADQLLRQADQAMYQAKLAGKNRYAVFDAENDHSVRGHHASLERIRQALASDEFVLYYQPKVNLRTREFIGVEALIRWLHPQRGLLAPAHFLPLIENHQLCVEVGEWVIRQALKQLADWQRDGTLIPISVNIGAMQLQQTDFIERLQAALKRFPTFQPYSLQLEILETSALEDIEQVTHFIKQCGELGVDFALDDFGTGYSSLTYLKQLPISIVKIDQSFVRDMLLDRDNRSILDGILWIMRQLNRSVVAEGVETLEHGKALMDLGCELAQGYGIARPMPADELPAWLRRWQVDAAWIEVSLVPRTAV